MPQENDYFDIQADMGITKHMGGRIATKELAGYAHIKENDLILEIGCGMGRTACFLAQEYGCKIISIDISPKMVERSTKRAKRLGLEDQVEFRVANAQELPFDDNTFDSVIDESVSAFFPDQLKAFKEFKRVLKPKGYLAINEVSWTKTPPDGMIEYLKCVMGGVNFHSYEGWKELLSESGFENIEVHERAFNKWEQFVGEIQQLDIIEYLQGVFRFSTQLFVNPQYWRFIRNIFKAPKHLFTFTKHIGQGFYVGQKP